MASGFRQEVLRLHCILMFVSGRLFANLKRSKAPLHALLLSGDFTAPVLFKV
ncbi:hypothetical protein [Sulfurovum mangrovi]|uniref:hypothetical protein n=1 Tax=Sulfurovum mangrovi TaxID=2893889 RepID=UPI001E5060B1|nr:hypothetical protein [Sulfurovum mangrovi]UFH59377.1 hypothetical protein LN246_00650 [Sulfurovum mangrovi]